MIDTYYKMVDDAIADLGLNPEETRGQQEGQWNLKKGRFDIMVDVWEQEQQYIFQVVAPLCGMPDENREAFMQHLLEKNYGLSSLAYAILNDTVFLKYTTEARSMIKEHIVAVLTKIAFYAEQSSFVPQEN
ncbi:MAG: YbjN domain-containing protein [Bacteroidia bacterium]|nr:YbjN domain-containing protein [Bacteroidia bacterium]